jgi:2-keto-4-pentenoate hydratase/2-oxohepta-3-ene-1,7-dioic acid hydratase in catechol pathway
MRLATFLAPGDDLPRAGEVRRDEVVAFAAGTVLDRLATGDRTPATGDAYALADVTLLAPVPRPRAIFGIGRNYAAHAAETGSELPKAPLVFMKLPTSSVPPGGPVRRPAVVHELDYEVELAVVIGRTARRLTPENAMDHVFGYTIVNDVTARDVQVRHQQWDLGKSFDTFCPMGPWIVSADEIDGRATRVRGWVNGELRQDGLTRDMIFDIPTLIETCSRGITLYPGDVIATGTPSGVGMGFSPPRWLVSGDVVRIEIDGIGAIENRFE